MERLWKFAPAVLALATLGGGCSNSVSTLDASSGAPKMVEPVREIPAQAASPIADVPLPVGFRLDEDRSRNFTAAGARVIEHLYKGSADKIAVHRFFKRQMPTARWALMRDVFVQGEIHMDFDNQRETCRIIITDGSWFRPTYVRVLVLPMGRIADDQSDRRMSMR